MKVITEIENEGLDSLMGKKVILFCANYFYTGILVGVNTDCVKLKNPAIVYETGAFKDDKYKDEQSLCTEFHYVMGAAIESFGLAK